MGFFNNLKSKSKEELAIDRLLNSKDKNLRWDSALELGGHTKSHAVAALMSARDDPDVTVRRMIYQSLIKTCKSIKESKDTSYSSELKEQIKVLANDCYSTELKNEAILALENIEGKEQYQKYLDDQSKIKKTEEETKRRISRSKSDIVRSPDSDDLLRKTPMKSQNKSFFDFFRPDPDKLTKKGIEFYELGRNDYAWNDRALNMFDEAISMDPNCSDAWYYKGKLLFDRKKYDDALIALDKLIEINPTNLDALSMKDSIYRNHLKKYYEAISICQKMLQIDPNNIIALSSLTESFYRTAQYENSIDAADKCIIIGRTNPYDHSLSDGLFFARTFRELSLRELSKK